MTPFRDQETQEKSLFSLAAELGLLELSDLIQNHLTDPNQKKTEENHPENHVKNPFDSFSRLT